MSRGQVRIIGGMWRGRKLKVPNIPNLRPTPDRVRETLFNWLAPYIEGAHCLDAFAGSGGLGFEALSRGASGVVMVDASLEVVKLLREEAKLFKADNVEIYQAQVPHQLKQPASPFDVVFLDPPFQQDLLLPTCFYLSKHGFLKPGALIYLESKVTLQEAELPRGWEIIKSKIAGQVAYQLIRIASMGSLC